MATLGRGYTFGVTEEVTAAKLHALVDSGTVTSLVSADITDATITDAKISSVSGSKLTELANIPSGSGVIPAANLTSVAQKGANTDITSLSGLTTALSTAQGGTGSTANANAANGVVVLDASSKLPAVDGSQLTGITAGGLQEYTSGSGNWTCPTGITRVTVTCVGGGGGGASGAGDNAPGGGGQSGHTVTVVYKVIAGNNYAYSVGALGAGATGGALNGSAGGNTTFGTGVVITALGGLGGVKNSGVPAITYGTTYGAGFFHNGATNGTGGSTYWGAGGVRRGHYTAGTAGGGYGAGGGGGYGNGGNGVGGVILIEY